MRWRFVIGFALAFSSGFDAAHGNIRALLDVIVALIVLVPWIRVALAVVAARSTYSMPPEVARSALQQAEAAWRHQQAVWAAEANGGLSAPQEAREDA